MSPRLLSRRAWLAWILTAGALGTFGLVRWRRRDAADLVVAILERRVGFLQVDRESFAVFARDWLAVPSRARRPAQFAVVSGVFRHVNVYDWVPPGHAFRRFEDAIVSNYLLSTDFFDHGADEARTVTYLGAYDPVSAICRNPFGRQVSSDTSTARSGHPAPSPESSPTSSSAAGRQARS